MPIPSTAPKSPTPTGDLSGLLRPASSAATGSLRRIAARPNEAFWLLAHPLAWDIAIVDGVVEGKKLAGTAVWVPDLVKLVEAPGANGIRVVPSGQGPEAAYTGALRARLEAGWTVLDRTEAIASVYLPPGVPEGPYIREVDCQDPLTHVIGVHYLEAWQVPVASVGDAKQRFRFDRDAHTRWRASLCLRGLIAPPSEEVRREVRARLEAKIGRIEVQPLATEVVKRRLAKPTARLAELGKAMALSPATTSAAPA